MGNQSIKFSLLIPVYNVAEYVAECLQSVLKQTYDNYEVIVVDDGSTDESSSIIDDYAKQYTQIKVFHKRNQGLIHTRRYAINMATGNYYVMLDSDDLIAENTLEILYDTIMKNQCDCVFFNRKLLKGNTIIGASYHIEEEYVTDKRTIMRKALIDIPYNGIVLKCAKATLYSHDDYSDYYHLQKGEDLLQSIELLKNCRTAEFIDDELYIYRERTGSIINSKTVENYVIDYTIRKKVLQFIIEENCFLQKDINDYRDKCIDIFINQIKDICLLNTSIANKRHLFGEIRKDIYYICFLSQGISNKAKVGKKRIIYYLFNKSYDFILLCCISLNNKIITK